MYFNSFQRSFTNSKYLHIIPLNLNVKRTSNFGENFYRYSCTKCCGGVSWRTDAQKVIKKDMPEQRAIYLPLSETVLLDIFS